MLLRHLTLHEFRNYRSLRQEFSPALNALIGQNAQGKTNALEAVYLLATGKSMRGSKDSEMIRWDAAAAVVGGDVLREKVNDLDLEVSLSHSAPKGLVVNTRRVQRANEFIGQLKAVAFSPSDLEMIREEPARRRRFLDLEISQLSPQYCHALGCYRKVLEQRNRLLKQLREQGRFGGGREAALETLAVWTEQLVSYGSRLVERRRRFLAELEEHARPLHELLTDQRERLGLAYVGTFKTAAEDFDGIQEAFRTALSEVRQEELRRQVTLIGPHRDDVQFLVNGRDVRPYGSQGQQRTVALSLRLGEVLLMTDLAGEAPVCLLDDVFSELDSVRRARIFDITLDRCQTFLSTTDLGFLPAGVRQRATVFEVRDGAMHQSAGAGLR